MTELGIRLIIGGVSFIVGGVVGYGASKLTAKRKATAAASPITPTPAPAQ